MFNAIVTAIAICAYAVYDQDINFSDKIPEKPLIDFFMPQIYKDTRENDMFNLKKFFLWMILSMV
jgi:Phospholipid-translocating P-type ATPase C-terminal